MGNLLEEKQPNNQWSVNNYKTTPYARQIHFVFKKNRKHGSG